MAYYNICPYCEAHLDPGESCDCQDIKEKEKQKVQSMLIMGKNGQMQMRFEREVSNIAEVGI